MTITDGPQAEKEEFQNPTIPQVPPAQTPDHSTQSTLPTPDQTSAEASDCNPPSASADAQPRLVTGSAYLTLPRSADTWLLEPILPVGGSMLLYGDPKVGKSFAALQLASALASGKDWLGFSSGGSCRVCYIQLDTPRSLWADRVGRLRESGHEIDALLFGDRETLQTWPFDILDPAHRAMLSEALASAKPDVVIIDTLRECHRGDENDATDMQQVVSHLTACVKPAALVMVAHGRKANPESGPSLINDNRGSNYVVGAVDCIAHMSKKGISLGGRAIDETFIRLHRVDDGTWELADRDHVKVLARKLLEDPMLFGMSLREKAGLLAAQTDKTHAACLSVLQRMSSDLRGDN